MKSENILRRIKIEEKIIAPDAENLKLLQRQFLLSVPFENLDIHWKRPIVLDTAKFYEKIVGGRRGGFCYELNGLFYELLNEIGYRSRLVSARVSKGNAEFGAEYDHMAILCETGGETFLADVGFGSFIAEPLRFVLDIEQEDANGTFAIRKFDEDYFEVVKKDGEIWQSVFIFKDTPRDLSEFAGMCLFHQTSPESHFTHGKICSLMLERGRKTLTDKSFIETRDGAKNETNVGDEHEFDEILEREFSIVRDER